MRYTHSGEYSQWSAPIRKPIAISPQATSLALFKSTHPRRFDGCDAGHFSPMAPVLYLKHIRLPGGFRVKQEWLDTFLEILAKRQVGQHASDAGIHKRVHATQSERVHRRAWSMAGLILKRERPRGGIPRVCRDSRSNFTMSKVDSNANGSLLVKTSTTKFGPSAPSADRRSRHSKAGEIAPRFFLVPRRQCLVSTLRGAGYETAAGEGRCAS